MLQEQSFNVKDCCSTVLQCYKLSNYVICVMKRSLFYNTSQDVDSIAFCVWVLIRAAFVTQWKRRTAQKSLKKIIEY